MIGTRGASGARDNGVPDVNRKRGARTGGYALAHDVGSSRRLQPVFRAERDLPPLVPGTRIDEETGFIAAMAADPRDRLAPLVYADRLDDRADPRGRLLRAWVELARFASHAGAGFCDPLAEYRRRLAAADPNWRRRVGAACPWVDGPLAEELARGYLRYVERRPPGRPGVVAGRADRFDEPFAAGRLVRYWLGRPPGRREGHQWMLFVQGEFGWVYTVATCGPRPWLPRYDVAAGQGRQF